jgi:hypothetical protein
MRAFFPLPCLACLFILLPTRGPAATLVENGVPKATIVVAKNALTAEPEPKPDKLGLPVPTAEKVAAAAHDLQTYLQKITGAKLPIVADEKDPGGTVLLVGKSALTKSLDDKIPSGATPVCEEEGFVIVTRGDRVLLAGNDNGPYHGTEYAVAEFLDRLGVRWFMPGDFGEVVPHEATIKVDDGEVRQKPDFKMRNWWGAMPPENARLEHRWKIRNKMNPVLHFITLPGDSSFRGTIPADLAKKEPDLFSLTPDGKPDPGMPNLSNPKAAVAFADLLKERFRKEPALMSQGFSPDDGLPRDWRPESVQRNLGFPDQVGRTGVPAEQSISEEWFDFVNRVAREVKKEFPDRILTANGYANRNTPPVGTELEKNVWIMFAAIWADTLHAYDNPRSWQAVRQGQMIKRWSELCKNVFMYDYTYIMLASAGTPVPLARKHAHDMPLLKKWGVIGFSDEGRRVLGESGIAPPYLRAKLMWNAGLDADAVLDDFFTKWYGPAARPARAFWDALEKTMETTPLLGHEDRILPYVYSPELVAELDRHVALAEKLAESSPLPPGERDRVRGHVRADRLILEHLRGYLAMTAAEWACNFAEAVKQADVMLAQRKQLHALSPFFFLPDDAKPESGFYYWGVVARKAYYQKLADQVGGKTGDLVAVLPEEAHFRTDPRDEGRFAGWFAADLADKDWRSLHTTRPFYTQGYVDEQGYPYMGAMWYRFSLDVPAAVKGKKVRLYAPAVETEVWGWVNGRFVGHRPYHEAYERPNEIDLDVTEALLPGQKNTIALRVHTGMGASQAADGMVSRAFLYAPKQ